MTASGLYHCSVRSIGRGNGASVVAKAAYRAGVSLVDERTGQTADYRARGGVDESFIVARADAPAWAHQNDIGRLWNEAERAEPRVNGRTATEIIIALPHELDADARRQAAIDFVRPIVDRHGVAAQVSLHAPDKQGDQRNWHAHILFTHRELGADGFGDIANRRTIMKKVKGQEKPIEIAGIAATPADIKAIRKEWEQVVNHAYERAGLDIQVDHRSHKDRGIEQEPTIHLGPNASQMERSEPGSSDRAAANREITQRNAARILAAMREAEVSEIKAEIADLSAAEIFRAAADRAAEPVAPVFDRETENIDWEASVQDAAIKAADQQQDRRQSGASAGRETRGPTAAGPYAELRQEPEPKHERPLGKMAGEIRTAVTLSRSAEELDEALAARGISLAAISAEEARESERKAAFAKEVGNFARVLREGEIVAVNGYGQVHRLAPEIENRFPGIDPASLLSVTATREALREAARGAHGLCG